MIDPHRALAKKTDFVTRAVRGETIVLPVRSGVAGLESIFTLNPVAGAIWELIDGQRNAEDIASEITRQFAVDPATAQLDVMEFLADLESAGLLESPPE